MPYKSEAQRKYFNANKDKIGKAVVAEFNKATKGKKLPPKKRKKGKTKYNKLKTAVMGRG